jgi:Ca2+-binding EF-hand superfamily protein
VAQIDEYKKLRDALRLFDNNATSKVKVGDTVLADVGSGVAVETKL